MPYPVAHLAVSAALLGVAAFSDARARRIPNAVNGALAVAGVAAQASVGGWGATLSGAAAGAVTLAALVLPWTRGALGGGDVKVAVAAAVWVGLPLLPQAALATAVAGGAVALVCWARSTPSARAEVGGNLAAVTRGVMPAAPIRGGEGRVSVPYGVAVALGMSTVLWRGTLW